MYVQRSRDAAVKYEYGCDLRRVYPWNGIASPLWGTAIASVRPGECTEPHQHNEFETFLVLSGKGEMFIGDESEEMTTGDVVFIPKEKRHRFANLSQEEPLVFLTIFWDSPEARERMGELVGAGKEDI
ncbi:MAG: cupin domain-containing protein [Acidobacteriia bacterium]|nr:cupin domain-containing protein [Terriglobia bacterium]